MFHGTTTATGGASSNPVITVTSSTNGVTTLGSNAFYDTNTKGSHTHNHLPMGTIDPCSGTITVPTGTITAGTGTVSTATGTVSACSGTISTATGTISTVTGTISGSGGTNSSAGTHSHTLSSG